MARRTLFFKKRCGGVFFRCGCCGGDVRMGAAGELGTSRDGNVLQAVADASGTYLMLGNTLHALLCSDCVPQVRRDVERLVPRSFPDVDDQGWLLGDF